MKRMLVKLVLLVLLLAPAWSAFAQTDYQLLRSIVSNGGGRSQGGEYALASVIDPFSHNTPIQGGSFSINGGFLSNSDSSDPKYKVFLPVVLK